MRWRSIRHPSLCIALLASLVVFWPRVADSSPNGGTGRPGGVWRVEWTKTFNRCFEDYGGNLKIKYEGGKLTDGSDYCTAGKSNVEANDYYLSIFIPLAYKESTLNPEAEGKNGARVPAGLYQMDKQDMDSYGCKAENTTHKTVSPKDPDDAICCAIKIANKRAGDKSRGPIGGTKDGFFSAFWQPMRDGKGGDGRGGKNNINNSENHEDIQKAAQKLCSQKPASQPSQIDDPMGKGRGIHSEHIYKKGGRIQ